MQKEWTVYRITNVKNDMYYTGMTSQTIGRRLDNHWSDRKRHATHNLMYQDMQNQDRSDFIIESLVGTIPNEKMAREFEHIYMHIEDEKCYNRLPAIKQIKKGPGSGGANKKEVHCKETATVYKSVKVCADELNLNLSNLHYALKVNKTYKNYTITYI
jgi:hypothetical protein